MAGVVGGVKGVLWEEVGVLAFSGVVRQVRSVRRRRRRRASIVLTG